MTVIIVKSTTKKAQAMLENAKNYEGCTLNEIYGAYSFAKYQAFLNCLYKCQAENGRNFHITSHNTFGFSVAWEVADGVRIETPNNSYFIPYN